MRQPFTLAANACQRPDDDGVTFEFFDAGHVLGSAGIVLRAEGRTIFYTGDVNFDDQTIDAGRGFPGNGIDVLIIETHARRQPVAGRLHARREKNGVWPKRSTRHFARGGCVLIPVFALGKTQEVLAMIYKFRREKLLGDFPIYIGGLSTKMTEIYDRRALTSAPAVAAVAIARGSRALRSERPDHRAMRRREPVASTRFPAE